MVGWDEVWAGVSVPARAAFLGLPLPARARHDPPEVILTGPARDELRAAGLAEAVDPKRVSIAANAVGFARRLRALRECRLLDPAGGELREYVRSAFLSYQLPSALDRVLTKNVGTVPGLYTDDYLTNYVCRRFWPDWVAKFLADPVATQIVQCLDAEAGPIPLASLAGRLPKRRPDKVRAALD